jgi:23S rRNA (adenine2030-N6)-methyltransferase
MNYRHVYHAGNFADVLKHTTLARVIEHLKKKAAPFRFVDTHAGSGRYTLGSPQALKTREWASGIGRLLGPDAAPLPKNVGRLMASYLDAVRAENPPGCLDTYPGSPLIARQLLRPEDKIVVNELHPEERRQLELAMRGDRRAKVLALDGWVALKSLLPPKERRGIVLIDPPFEEEGELARLADGLAEALRRFATGVYLAWYPIKDARPIARFHDRLAAAPGPDLLRAELLVHGAASGDRLNGCGLIIANAPYTLQGELADILPELTRRLGLTAGARYRLDHIVRDSGTAADRAPFLRHGKRSGA